MTFVYTLSDTDVSNHYTILFLNFLKEIVVRWIANIGCKFYLIVWPFPISLGATEEVPGTISYNTRTRDTFSGVSGCYEHHMTRVTLVT